MRISGSEYRSRVEHVRKEMERKGIDVLLLFSSYPEREGNVSYLTGYHGAFPPSQTDGVYVGFGVTALGVTKDNVVLFPGLLQAAGETHGIDRVEGSQDIPGSVGKFIAKSKVGVVGADVIPYQYLDGIRRKAKGELVNAGGIMERARMSKSSQEVAILRRGAEIADKALQAAHEATREGVRESDLGLAAMKACYDEGADYVARTRVYAKSVSGVRWPIMTNKRLKRGDLTGVDLVGWYSGYGFDVLRRWAVGRLGRREREDLERASTLTEETTKGIRRGMTGDEVSKLTMRIGRRLEAESTSPFGHSIGLEIVESPFLLPGARTRLPKSAFLCVEPGYESKSSGSIHIEDEVYINEAGRPETVSRCPKIFD